MSKKKTKEQLPSAEPDRQLRDFYVNGKLEFSLWFEPEVEDKDQIIEEFMDDRDWKFMSWYCGWTFVSAEFSDDLLRVDIKVRTRKRKD